MILLVGFDSAWTPNNSGAIAAALCRDDGSLREIQLPLVANYTQAEDTVVGWQNQFALVSTVILLDQPLIVRNLQGQRPVEGIVASAVSARLGGMQPANISRAEMFGPKAPIWSFLQRFGGPADPLSPTGGTLVYETYPVLVLISLEWTLPGGRLPNTTPANKDILPRGLASRVYVRIDRILQSRSETNVSLARRDCRSTRAAQE